LVLFIKLGINVQGESILNHVQNAAFEAEIVLARTLMSQGDLKGAFSRLERAHVIGQSHVVPHVVSHWLMLIIALRQYQLGSAWGQVVRIVMGAVGSAAGVVPTGNTGGSNVSMFQRMPIEPELQDIIAGRASNHTPRGRHS
jgi:hypothetical protein